MPPVAPPSYLRPPARPPGSRSAVLMLWTGIAALVLIISGWFVFYAPRTAPIALGSLAFFSLEPAPGVYAYALSSGKLTELSTSPRNGATPLYEVAGASFSPNALFAVESRVNREKTTPLIVAIRRPDGSAWTMAAGPAGAHFISPVISNDGSRVAYLSVAPLLVSTKTSAKSVASVTSSLKISVRSGEEIVEKSLQLAGIPLAFSPNNSALLVQGSSGLALIDIRTDGLTLVAGLVTPASTKPHVALSPDGKRVAIALPDGVHMGTLDWTLGVFTEESLIKNSARALFFEYGGRLMLLEETGARLYSQKANNLFSEENRVPLTIPSGAVPLAWLTIKL